METSNTVSKLKFKPDSDTIGLTEDFFYMISDGGWCMPENFLEKEDAEKVRNAINIIKQYEIQGIDEGYFANI